MFYIIHMLMTSFLQTPFQILQYVQIASLSHSLTSNDPKTNHNENCPQPQLSSYRRLITKI